MRIIALVAAVVFVLSCPRVTAQPAVVPPQASAPDPGQYAEAERHERDSIYHGTVKDLNIAGATLTLWIDRVLLPGGKALDLRPARTRAVRLAGDVTIRTADATGLQGSVADLVPGAEVDVLGTALPEEAGKSTVAFPARVILVRSDGGEPLAGNLLKTPAARGNWQFRFNDDGAPGSTFAVSDNTLKITVGGNPVREWHAQIFQIVDILPLKPYTLRFRARADTRHFMTVGSETDGSANYANLGLLETILLTPRWQTFQFTFTTLGTLPGRSRLPVFSVGHRGGAVYLADVSLVPGEIPPPPSLRALHAARERDAASGKNLLTDSNDADTWFLFSTEQARGTLKQETDPRGGPMLAVTVTAASREAWHLILMRPSLDLKEGKEYTLRFLARADRAREIEVQSQVSKGDFHNLGLSETIALGTTWKACTIKFTTRGTLPEHNRLPQFCLGRTDGTVWLANASLVESK
jgi:hypothetical protein